MEINYQSELNIYLSKLYDTMALNCKMFSDNGHHDAATMMAQNAMHQAYGAVQFLVAMLNENGYSDVAGEIITHWNNVQQNNFASLIYDYR